MAKVTVRGPSGPSATHTCRRPISSQVPSTSSPSGRQPCAQPRPDGGDLALVVLPQHVRRADQRRARSVRERDLEAAVPEGQPLALVRLRGRDPRRVDLHADDPRSVGRRVRSRPSSSTAVQGAAP